MEFNKIPYWQDRLDIVDKNDKAYGRYVKELQDAITEAVVLYSLSRLTTDKGGLIMNTVENILIVAAVDRFIQGFLKKEAQPTLHKIVDSFDEVIDVNKKYMRAQTKTNLSDSQFSLLSDQVRRYTLTFLGIQTGKVILRAGSRLWDALMSTDFTKIFKSILLDAVENQKPVGKLRREIEIFGKGGKDRPGEYEKQVYNVLPNPGELIENVYGLRSAIKYGLYFARYQGGIIKTSRDFCRERNNKIFHVSEIAKFGTPKDEHGGYKNKKAGEFQGKTKVYNPFYDLGGYNCRHRYFFISTEYAYRDQPDLKDKIFTLPDFFKDAEAA